MGGTSRASVIAVTYFYLVEGLEDPMSLVDCRFPVDFAPMSWRHAFPTAESTSEGVRVFIAKQVGSFVELKDRVSEVIPSHLMPRFIENALEARSGFL